MTLSLRSTSFQEGDTIPAKHHMSEAYGLGCSGGNISPEYTGPVFLKELNQSSFSVLIRTLRQAVDSGIGL